MIVAPDGQPQHPRVVMAGAVPFCFQHDQVWQPACTECAAARPVRDMLEEHRAVYPACDTWPLCGHGTEDDAQA